MRRLVLVRHAPTSATRGFVFPADEPLDGRGLAAARRLGPSLPGCRETLCSPALRSRQTAEAAGLVAPRVVDELAECEFGAWAGRTLADVCALEADAAHAWMTDPLARPHGGESLAGLAARVGGWLDQQAALESEALVITHGGVVKAAVVHALGAPLEAFWQISVAPLAITELRADEGRWTVVRLNCAVDAPPGRGP